MKLYAHKCWFTYPCVSMLVQKQEMEAEEQRLQQEAADQRMQTKQDTHSASDKQRHAEVCLS